MQTGVKNKTEVITGTGVSTLEVKLPPNCVSIHVILTHGSGSGSVEKTLLPSDYPGSDYESTRFGIAFIAGGGFSYRGVNKTTINFRPYNTTGDVANDGGTYKLTIVTGA